jgi:uncharacterized protein YndB with AHSA1/START domain
MQQIRKTVEIHAPVEQVFNYLLEPTNLPEIWPSVVEVSNVERSEDGTCSFDWTYKMAGMRFPGHYTQKVVSPKEYVEAQNESGRVGIPSSFRWTYESKAGWCELTCEVDYTVPVPVLGRLAEVAAATVDDRDLETMLANVRHAIEVPVAKKQRAAGA